jgi:hypothetical protein
MAVKEEGARLNREGYDQWAGNDFPQSWPASSTEPFAADPQAGPCLSTDETRGSFDPSQCEERNL